MRLSFPHGEHADVVAADMTDMSIGSASDNQIVLAGGDVAPLHARIVIDRRGCILDVLDPAGRTHLNARPIRKLAFLRAGDTLCIGSVTVALKEDQSDAIVTSLESFSRGPDDSHAPPSRIVLRGLNGPWSGKSVVIDRKLIIGRDGGSDLTLDETRLEPQHAAIENHGDVVFLRGLGENSDTSVNGVPLRNAVLHSGDQIMFDRQRFMLEAPGLPVRGAERAAPPPPGARPITQIMPAMQLPAFENPVAASHSIWWLIGAGAVIGLAIVALLLWGNH